MRTVYLGSSDFAALVLERLADSPHAPVLVLTRPDAPRGRGLESGSPPAAEAARALGIPLAQPADLNGEAGLQAIRDAAPYVLCLCAYGQLVREPLLSDHLILNLHPSLLPRWRGAAPIERAIMAGDGETGVSIMRLTEGLDSGPVCGSERLPIGPDDDYGTLSRRLSDAGTEALLAALDEVEGGLLSCVEQDESSATYADKLGPEDRRLDLQGDAQVAALAVRALAPHIGAHLGLPGGERLKVWRAASISGSEPPAGSPGAVRSDGGRLWVGFGTGALELLEVQPAGGRRLPVADHLRGHEPPPEFS